jgi:uncharacterized membrane protein (DUF2068 family)
VIFVIAYAVWKFANNENSLRDLFEQDVTVFKPVADHWGYDLDHATFIDRIRHSFDYSPKAVHVASLALVGYALLETVEGVGLWLAKRWGEYLTAVGTSIFLPLEIWDGYSKFQDGKSIALAVGTFTINVAAVLYLLITKRLFGIRGGGAKFEALKHADSLITVELAACGHVPPTRAEEAAAEKSAEKLVEAAEISAEKGTRISTENGTENSRSETATT